MLFTGLLLAIDPELTLSGTNFCFYSGIFLYISSYTLTNYYNFSSRHPSRSLLGTRRRPGRYNGWNSYRWIRCSPVIPFGCFNVGCGFNRQRFHSVLYILSLWRKEKWRKARRWTHYGMNTLDNADLKGDCHGDSTAYWSNLLKYLTKNLFSNMKLL